MTPVGTCAYCLEMSPVLLSQKTEAGQVGVVWWVWSLCPLVGVV